MKRKIMKTTEILFLLFIFFPAASPYTLEARQKTARGIVFEDANRNGVFDKGEKGIPGVVVSNQIDAVQTGETGHYRLPVGKETIIFVSKPADYEVPLDANHLPQFYTLHQPAGSPAGLEYKGIEPTGKLPRSIDFPLIKGKKEETFSVIVMGDPQTKTPEELAYYRDNVVTEILGKNARFYLALGDIMYDDLSLYPQMNRLVGQIGIPLYHVLGNHDMNYRIPGYQHEAETFKRHYGPDYYSFNYGSVHFVVLNSVKYNGWNKEENKKGDYSGYLHERQLTWLKNDLSFVPPDHLVVLAMHIPVDSGLYHEDFNLIVNREALFKILETREHLLALAGHMHFVEYQEFTGKNGWHGKAEFPSLTAGAACGTWWHGPKDPRGIPYGMCTDGAPNGYFSFTFTGNRFNYRFYPSNSSLHSQMRINSPVARISSRELPGHSIEVNIFAGTPRTVVTYQLDDGPGTAMERKIMPDSFFSELVKANPDSYSEWMKPSNCSHLWVAPLPEHLEPGLHRLKVTAVDHQGDVFTAYRLFEIGL